MERVFDLLTTETGLKQWWTMSARAAPRVGAVNTFSFGDGSVEMRFSVDQMQPPTHVSWTCLSGPNTPDEWVGTRLIARLDEDPAGTRLRFSHSGWRSETGAYALCNSTWGDLMDRLRSAAEDRPRGPRFVGRPNSDTVRLLYQELMGNGDVERGRELLAEGYVDHDIPGVGEGGRDQLIDAVLAVRAAFPDIAPALDQVLVDGSFVAVRVQARGRHSGTPFMGVPPSGREILWREQHVFRCEEGRIAEHWGVFDVHAILVQLGAIGTSGSKPA